MAEVTISLSNGLSEAKKIISIKKITDIVDEKEKSEQEVDHSKTTLKLEIDRLQNELAQLEAQKESLLTSVRRTIDEERKAWELEKEKEREQAKEMGYKEGYEIALQEVERKYQTMLNEANEITFLAKEEYDKTISKYQQAIVQLAVAIANKIVTTSIEEKPEYFSKLVETAILDLKDSSNVELHVHPSQYKFIMEQKEEFEQIVRNEDVISIYINKQLQPNSCIIKHPYGQIDVSVDTQLEQIRQALEEKIMER